MKPTPSETAAVSIDDLESRQDEVLRQLEELEQRLLDALAPLATPPPDAGIRRAA